MHNMPYRLLFGFVLSLVLQFSLVLSNPPGLNIGFYQYTCPKAEVIVRDEMTKIISRVPSLAGPLLRMHFHDCFVNVCILLTML